MYKEHMSTKKAFELARNSIYVASPDELCIIGGKCLPFEQQSPLDTRHKEGEHELWDPRLLDLIAPETVANVDAYGVHTPIIITKINDIPTVVDGRGRVRRARLANALRKARGEPLISIECKVARPRLGGLMGLMISANEVRVNDGVASKISKLRVLLSTGVSEFDATVIFGVSLATVRGWLRYEDNASSEVKEAVASGEISTTAAVTLARRPVAEQVEALAKVRKAPSKTARAARSAVSPRPGRKLVELVYKSACERVDSTDSYWAGVTAALHWSGTGTPEGKLKKIVERLTEKAP